jgi:HSP20 family protein
MNLRPYQTNTWFNQLQNDIKRLFELQSFPEDSSLVATSDWAPSVDIKEEANRFVVYADIPGVNPSDVQISMENNVLTLQGERTEEKKEEKDNYSRIERVKGSFYRRFALPDTADGEHITAHSHQGVLEIAIPKKEQAKPRKITIQVNGNKSSIQTGNKKAGNKK